MDQAPLVERAIDEGLWIIRELSRNHFDVTAAFWLKVSESEDGQWFLYIASKMVDENGLHAAYRSLHEILKHKPDLWISPFDVKLIGATNPIARDVLAIRGPRESIPTRYHGPRVGKVNIEEAYIYGPLPAPSGAGV
jgi:hypothetical protein